MIQTKTLNCPSCGAELLDPIYDLEMVDGGRRRLTCGECGGHSRSQPRSSTT